jgi:intracellular septation protein A
MQTTENTKLTELEMNTRIILLHIRRGAFIFCLTALGLLLTQFFADIRLWIPFAILGVLSVTVLGDVIRYLYCVRQMKRMRPDQDAQRI